MAHFLIYTIIRTLPLIMSGSEADSPGVLKLLWSEAESRRTCLRVNEVPLPPEGRFGADARAPIITFSIFTQNNPFPKDFSKERGV